ncbi:putative serine/threonine-protein [Faustovirus]|nr:hypothetical protein F-LCD7_0396 [Faustovirus]QJX72164.1 putative serine/threonine-protein [Faustovirus]QJX72659.1 putative serine/threonine-protein [Faustovirus]QJX73156.1 poxvirus early transcription factor (VETF) large subunit [Faustovirus]QJX73663.1 poxvirus early transcription factor (VETF) large subunit [Faustovirus]
MDEKKIKSKIEKFFDCDNINKFLSLVIETTNYRGYSRSIFVICEYRGVRFLTKIALYFKIAPDLYDYKVSMHKGANYLQPVDMEIKTLQVLEEKIIRGGVSSCILEMIYHSCCENVIRLSKTLQKKKSRTKMSKLKSEIAVHNQHVANKTIAITNTLINYAKVVDLGLAHDKVSFIALEKYTLTLRTFLSKPVYLQMDAEIIRIITFQIIYTIYQIQRVLPGFKHNDLHTDNIMIKIDPDFEYDPKHPVFELYRTDLGDFLVPYLGFHAKIIDFAFAQIPSLKTYSYTTIDKEIMVMRMCNDIYFLMHDLRHTNEYGASIVKLIEPDMEDSLIDVEYDTNMLASYRRYLKSDAFSSYRYNKDEDKVDIVKTFELRS